MKHVKQVLAVVICACFGQIAQSEDQLRVELDRYNKQAIDILPATVRLKMRLVGNYVRYSSDVLIDKNGQVNQDRVKELMSILLPDDITQTPYYKNLMCTYNQFVAEGPEWIGDHDAEDVWNRMRDMRMIQSIYSAYIYPDFNHEGPAQAIETFLEWSSDWHN